MVQELLWSIVLGSLFFPRGHPMMADSSVASSSSVRKNNEGTMEANPFPGQCGQTTVPIKPMTLNTLNRRQRIAKSGVDAIPHSIPSIVSLRTRRPTWKTPKLGEWKYEHFCGGVLVQVDEGVNDTNIVISSASCAAKYDHFFIAAGAHYLNKEEKGEQRVAAEKAISHPEFSGLHRHDISVVKLSKRIKFSPTVQPICLPEETETVLGGDAGTVAGWGATEMAPPLRFGPLSALSTLKDAVTRSDTSNVLRQGIVQIVRDDWLSVETRKTTIVSAAGKRKGDACRGDYGGPYFFNGIKGYTLQGVTAAVDGCNQRSAEYARVTYYLPWIREQIQALTSVH